MKWLSDKQLVKLVKLDMTEDGKKTGFFETAFRNVTMNVSPEGARFQMDYQRYSSYCFDPMVCNP